MTNHPFESFSLSGLDTSKVGNNKFINYKLSDFKRDQNLSNKGLDKVLSGLNLDREDLKRVPKTTTLGKIENFLFKGARDYYLPKGMVDSLELAEKTKQQEINNDPLSIENLENALKINPWCLDFNSGVESAPGFKDHSKITKILSLIEK